MLRINTMNPRIIELGKLGSEFQTKPPISNLQIIERAISILKIIYPDGNTFLKMPNDQNNINLLRFYLAYVAKTLGLQWKTTDESDCVIEKIPPNYLQKMSALLEKEKFIMEVEKRMSQSYTTMFSQLNIKLDKVIHLLSQRPDVAMADEPREEKLEKKPEREKSEEGEVEYKDRDLQPGAR